MPTRMAFPLLLLSALPVACDRSEPTAAAPTGGQSTTAVATAPSPTLTPTPTATPPATPPVDVPAHAVLAFDDPIVDFGRIADFDKRRATVVFRNAGGADLRISKVEPTCGCTSVGFDTSRTYGPGESGEITLAFTPKGQGTQTKSVKVLSNDPEAAVRLITIKADVVPSLSAEPRVLQLGRIPLGERYETGTTLTALRPGIRLDRVEVSGDLGPHATASIRPAGTDSTGRDTWRVDVLLDDRIPWGWHTGSMVVSGRASTDEGDREVSMNFAINGSTEGEIRADDSMFRLMVVRPGQAINHSIEIQRRDGAAFHCEASGIIGDRTGGLTADARALDPEGHIWLVTLTGTAPTGPGSIVGSVLLTTDVPGEESIALRIGGVVRR